MGCLELLKLRALRLIEDMVLFISFLSRNLIIVSYFERICQSRVIIGVFAQFIAEQISRDISIYSF